jgi:hypothetical protein
VSPSGWWRRTRRHFSIDAPRMAVRSHLPWPWRAIAAVALVLIVAGMWWWGFDFGQIFGGFNRKEVEARIAALQAENSRLRADAEGLAARNARQESEFAMMAGMQATLTKQVRELQRENSQVHEELAFLQKLVADSSRQPGLAIPSLTLEPDHEDAWRYKLLLVRGGNPKTDFEGNVILQVTLQPASLLGSAGRPAVLTLPDEQPGTAAALKLKFKYYQRLEGTFTVPKGTQVRSVTVRAYEAGQSSPRATRTLVIA